MEVIAIEFLVEINKKIYEMSELIKSITFTDKLNDGASKLEFSYIDDNLKIVNGSIVRFKFDGSKIFYGVVFKHGKNEKNEVPVTAYGRLRYAKAKDTIVIKADTSTTLTKKMCSYLGLTTKILSDTKYKLPVSVQDSKTWLDIIYESFSDTLMGTGKKYCLRDEFDGVSIRELEDLKLDLILGDESYCYGYNYEASIDDNFYNQIKLVSDNEKSKKRDTYVTKDSKSINTYGLLQYFEVIDKNANPSQTKAMADALLNLYNREQETLSMQCLGDTRVRAGNSFLVQISDIGIKESNPKRLIVKEVTHAFIPHHTMKLEVML